MQIIKILKPISLSLLVLAASAMQNLYAQQKGDEEGMQNQAQARDKKEIDKAMNGWWTASMKTHDARVEWWREARFGMFIHWGIYSLPGGEWKGKKVSGYAEHLMRKEMIPRAEYLELAHQFNPVKFNAEEWASIAQQAGMKYLIITAKHHDGFAMFNSGVSDFNVVKQTAWKHDPMLDLAAACKKHGIKFGFYYSHAFDWEHPDAPGNDWEYNNPGGDKLLFGGANWFDVHPELLPKAVNYVNQKAIPQIKELIKKYHPDILWFDTPGKLPLSENIRILEAIRETDPNVVVNGRLARGGGNLNMGDYQNTADRPAEFIPVTGDWEAIPTTNESYGYSKFDKSHKSAKFFVQLLAKSASRGGNLLMNIGPKGDGEFDAADKRILDSIGNWMKVNGASIYGTTKTPLTIQNWGVSTQKGNKLYLQVFEWPRNNKLIVGGLKSDIAKAYLLADPAKKPLSFKRLSGLDVELTIPTKAPNDASGVIVLESEKAFVTDSVRLLTSATTNNRLLAFDALLTGKGFKFGDGKPARYYVDGWKNKQQTISWKFRLLESGQFNLLLKYSADNANAGDYELVIDDAVKTGSAETSAKADVVNETNLGNVDLKAGVHTITIKAKDIKAAGLMRLLEVDLKPAK